MLNNCAAAGDELINIPLNQVGEELGVVDREPTREAGQRRRRARRHGSAMESADTATGAWCKRCGGPRLACLMAFSLAFLLVLQFVTLPSSCSEKGSFARGSNSTDDPIPHRLFCGLARVLFMPAVATVKGGVSSPSQHHNHRHDDPLSAKHPAGPPPTTSDGTIFPQATGWNTVRDDKKRQGAATDDLEVYDRLLRPPTFPHAATLCTEIASPLGEGVYATNPSRDGGGSPTSSASRCLLSKGVPTAGGPHPVVAHFQQQLPKIGSSFTSATTVVKDVIGHLRRYSVLSARNPDPQSNASTLHYAGIPVDLGNLLGYLKELKSDPKGVGDVIPPRTPRHSTTTSFLERGGLQIYNQSSQLLATTLQALPPLRFRRRIRLVLRNAPEDTTKKGGGGVLSSSFEVVYLPDYSDARMSINSRELADIGLRGLHTVDSNDVRHLIAQIALYADGDDCSNPLEVTEVLSVSTPLGTRVQNCNSQRLVSLRKQISASVSRERREINALSARAMLIVTGEPRDSAFRSVRSMIHQIVLNRAEPVDIIYSFSSHLSSLVRDPIVRDILNTGGLPAVESFLLRNLCPAGGRRQPRICVFSEILDPFSKDSFAAKEALLRWFADFAVFRGKHLQSARTTLGALRAFLRRAAHMPHALGGLPHSNWAQTTLSGRALMFALAEVRRLETHHDLRPVHHGSLEIKDAHGAARAVGREGSHLRGEVRDLFYDYFFIARVDALFTLPVQDYSWLGGHVVCPPISDHASDATNTAANSSCRLLLSGNGDASGDSGVPYEEFFYGKHPRAHERAFGEVSACAIPLGSPFGGYPDSHSICSRRGAVVRGNIVESTLSLDLPTLQQELAELSAGLNPEKFLLLSFEAQDVNVLYSTAGSHFISCGPIEGGWDPAPEMGFSCSRVPNVMCQCSLVSHSSMAGWEGKPDTRMSHPLTSKLITPLTGGSSTAEKMVEDMAKGRVPPPPSATDGHSAASRRMGVASASNGTDKNGELPYRYFTIPPVVGSRWTQTGEYSAARNSHGMFFRFPPRRSYVPKSVPRHEAAWAMALMERGLNHGHVNEVTGTGVASCADFAAYVVDLYLDSLTNVSRSPKTKPSDGKKKLSSGDLDDLEASARPTIGSDPKGTATALGAPWASTLRSDLKTFYTRRMNSLAEFGVPNPAHTILVSPSPPTDTLFTLPDRLVQSYCALREGHDPLGRIAGDAREALQEAASLYPQNAADDAGSSHHPPGFPARKTLSYDRWGDFEPSASRSTSEDGGPSLDVTASLHLPLLDSNAGILNETVPHLGWQWEDGRAPVAPLWGRLPSKKSRDRIKVKRK